MAKKTNILSRFTRELLKFNNLGNINTNKSLSTGNGALRDVTCLGSYLAGRPFSSKNSKKPISTITDLVC